MTRQYILVEKCQDKLKWYSNYIGKKFILLDDPDYDGTEWKTLQPDGYINFISTRDGKIVNKDE